MLQNTSQEESCFQYKRTVWRDAAGDRSRHVNSSSLMIHGQEEEFDTLASDTDLGVCDLVLLGVEHESAMTLFQDSSWEGYAQGSAEVPGDGWSCGVPHDVLHCNRSRHSRLAPTGTPTPLCFLSQRHDTNDSARSLICYSSETQQFRCIEAQRQTETSNTQRSTDTEPESQTRRQRDRERQRGTNKDESLAPGLKDLLAAER